MEVYGKPCFIFVFQSLQDRDFTAHQSKLSKIFVVDFYQYFLKNNCYNQYQLLFLKYNSYFNFHNKI